MGRMLVFPDRANTPSTIRSTPRSNDCKPMTWPRLLVIGNRFMRGSHGEPVVRPSRSVVPGGYSGWGLPGELLRLVSPLGRVAEWQTRWLQVPVFERMWGFKSPLAHSAKARAQLGLVMSAAEVGRAG